MTEQELASKYSPHQVSSQMEFDSIMAQINEDQAKAVSPITDAIHANRLQVTAIRKVISTLQLQVHELQERFYRLEGERKATNQMFHNAKHRLIMLNPKAECQGNNHEDGSDEFSNLQDR